MIMGYWEILGRTALGMVGTGTAALLNNAHTAAGIFAAVATGAFMTVSTVQLIRGKRK